ncbi:N-acetylglucosamine-6-phosphate deacetylase [Candidatus Amarolinea dominans]|uniref:N-acetylglucosamine-6-phosphate deacetylase n=1 Tax=Candidatus Amarolinea dominans TaxID=3140696 RepID=UPI0031376C26|nr:N-acetylglucosamine-6-phosphate deacetylase [Anaerolineae bacterium]
MNRADDEPRHQARFQSLLVIEHATVMTPWLRLDDHSVWLQGGRITALAPTAELPPPANATCIAAEGLIATPGWLDLQCNGGCGHDFTHDPSSLWTVAARLPTHGVTAFLPTIITAAPEVVTHALAIWRAGPPSGWRGARPLGLHLEGPFLNPGKKGAHDPAFMRQPSLDAIAGWTPTNGVRLVTLAPELPGALAVTAALRDRGIVVSAGHSLASFDEAQAGFQAGVNMGTHLFNAMPTLQSRAPGLAGALLTTAGVVTGLIADGIHVHPALVRLAWQCKGSQDLALVTDAMAALGMPDGVYHLGGYEVTVAQQTARLADGTLAGSVLALDAALRNLAAFSGCSLHEALPTITSTPARLLGLDRPEASAAAGLPGALGSIRAGAAADLTLVTPQGEVVMTIVGGEIFKAAE